MRQAVGIGFVLVVVILMSTSYRRIEAGKVGVKLNRFGNTTKVVDTEGFTSTIPFLQTLYILDASPQTLTLQGDVATPDRSVLPRLTVRASDGSNFWFEDENSRGMTVQYQIIPEMADVVIAESGPGSAYREWLVPTVRGILRDAFGKQSTMEVSDPTTYNISTGEAESLLNERLNPHGIRIINVDTPRPNFAAVYETTIEDRIQTENDITVISERQARALNTRSRRLAELDQTRNSTLQETRARLEGELARTQSDRRRRLTVARADLTREQGEALALLDAAEARAEQLLEQWNATVAETASLVRALESNGEEVVMRELSRRLSGVKIKIQPVFVDGAPQTVDLGGR